MELNLLWYKSNTLTGALRDWSLYWGGSVLDENRAHAEGTVGNVA
jgi:hypothetical protein